MRFLVERSAIVAIFPSFSRYASMLNWAFPYLHWLLTLLITPIILYLGSTESIFIHLLAFAFSFLVSLPFLAMYLWVFQRFVSSNPGALATKIILIGFVVLSITTCLSIFTRPDLGFAIPYYSITAIVTGLIIPIRSSIDRKYWR